MKTNITFRQMDSSDAIKVHVNEKLNKLQKYRTVDDSSEANVVLTVDGHRHLAEINYTSKLHKAIYSSETTDMYASLDEAISKLETSIRKLGDRLQR